MSRDKRFVGLVGTSGRGLETDDIEAERGVSLFTETQGLV